MEINHLALSCSSEEKADRFYLDLLGLEKLWRFGIPAELTAKFFAVAKKCEVVVYRGKNFSLEVFIVGREEILAKGYDHICFEIEDRDKFIEKCRQQGVAVNIVPKGDRSLLFVKDFDGNHFEVKERIPSG